MGKTAYLISIFIVMIGLLGLILALLWKNVLLELGRSITKNPKAKFLFSKYAFLFAGLSRFYMTTFFLLKKLDKKWEIGTLFMFIIFFESDLTMYHQNTRHRENKNDDSNGDRSERYGHLKVYSFPVLTCALLLLVLDPFERVWYTLIEIITTS